MKKLAKAKHSDLLRRFVNYGHTKFYKIGPCSYQQTLCWPGRTASKNKFSSLLGPFINDGRRKSPTFLVVVRFYSTRQKNKTLTSFRNRLWKNKSRNVRLVFIAFFLSVFVTVSISFCYCITPFDSSKVLVNAFPGFYN